MDIKDKLKEIRKRRGWTQAYVAKRLGIHQSAVANWEAGLRIPNLQHMMNLEALTEGEIEAKKAYPNAFKLRPFSPSWR